MIVVPAGSFNMGSPASEPGHQSNEDLQHLVTIAQQFAVGQFEVTFDEWDACAADGGCERPIYPGPGRDNGWGRGRRPVINVSWFDAQSYVSWLSRKTGRTYRLLTEAEWEYAARAGTTTAYSWGDTVGVGNANCKGCGSQWDNKQTAPVDSFAANPFGLFDVFGNARQWVEDCRHTNYFGAPSNGSAWTSADCRYYILRGGAYNRDPKYGRAASRFGVAPGGRYSDQSIRVARTLTP
jgi:formylglycine-generating enzyme required for sulfatase activity